MEEGGEGLIEPLLFFCLHLLAITHRSTTTIPIPSSIITISGGSSNGLHIPVGRGKVEVGRGGCGAGLVNE